MDGTKRKANGSEVRSTDLIDLGSTPPWPQVYYEESALRHTQSPMVPSRFVNPITLLHQAAAERTNTNPIALLHKAAAERTSGQDWDALNKHASDAHTPSKPQLRKRIGKRPHYDPRLAVQSSEDTVVHETETEDYSDKMYMINAEEGSWSGTLLSENDSQVQSTLPDVAVLALQHLKRAQRLAEKQQFVKQIVHELAPEEEIADDDEVEASDCHHCQRLIAPESECDQQTWQQDLLLRNYFRRVKKKLQSGAVLTLERLGPFNTTIHCAHPTCPAPGHLIPPGAYYFILGQPRQLESAER